MPGSIDSGRRPFNAHYRYESASNQDHDQYHDEGPAGYTPGYGYPQAAPAKSKGRRSRWIVIGIPVALIIIVAAVVAAVVATRHKSSNASTSSTGNGTSSGGGGGSGGGKGNNDIGVFFTATDAFGLPVYPTTTNSAAFGSPTFNPSVTASWPSDTTSFASPTQTAVRADHPRLIAPKYKWDALPSLIASDPYLAEWNKTIFGNATDALNADPIPYDIDGSLSSSGVLDVARQVKVRIKTLAYAYLVSNQTAYADRAWRELQNAAGNGTSSFGTAPDNWNSVHFLDLAEFTAAFAYGYDWLYNYWTQEQRDAIMWSMLNLGLSFGVDAYTNPQTWVGWWRNAGSNTGNWNCVCNGGLTMGALAIVDVDPTGMAKTILANTVQNAIEGCTYGPSTDGTWTETADYWYFGTTSMAEMSSSLISATGSDYGMTTTNPSLNLTFLYHMYATGMTSLFNWGDHGPNKYSATANAMMHFGNQFKEPRYTLFQRDRIDAREPNAVFWYDPTVTGAFWADMPLDHEFDAGVTQWASMRTSWTDDTGLYVGIKAGNATGHQTHGDLDAGDFVLDAMGQRWAGELGSGQYLADNYFSNETQTSERWWWYRCATEGQNTLLYNLSNQDALAQPTIKYGSSGDTQPGDTTVYSVPSDSTAFFTMDLTTVYWGVSVQRGLRLLNGRKQVLLQDDITNAPAAFQWRVQTNATITTNGATATMALGGQTMIASILNAPSGVTFGTAQPTRLPTDPVLPTSAIDQDQPNPGVTVLTIDIPTGTNSIQVLFNPQWPGMSSSDFVTPPSVPVNNWSLTSHNGS